MSVLWIFLEGDSKSTEGILLTLTSKYIGKEGSEFSSPPQATCPYLLFPKLMLHKAMNAKYSPGTIRTYQ